ncbi:MAG: DNA repair and recombination protein RadA [Caldisphaeraceae archaeon]|nr:DNA repair and recombination protein RadA [Caldisphaeraceae archaeon]MEB3798046.1 DNA repair and recombination protein RadA [Caldisphaeraceae archaeon]
MSTSSEEQRNKPKDITDLPGIGPNTAQKLIESGYTSIEALAVATPQEIAQVTGIPIPTAQKIVSSARSTLDIKFKTALELKKERMNVHKITTGSKSLDDLLGGGIETKDMTEFFGEYGTGKTQICHQLAVNVQMPEDKGGLSAKAVFIDTEGTFRWERIEQLAIGINLDPDKVMENIYWIRAVNSHHQMAIVDQLYDMLSKDNIKLVILDSLTSHFRAEFPGRENLAMRQQLLNRHLHQLIRLAEIYDVAVVVTNQVMSRPDIFYGDPTAAVGGHIVGHAPGIRVQLKRSRGNKRIARVVDAPHLPEGETVFIISEYGIRDVEE